jgi:TRAP-type C4-dicarboxylate transport system permease small subunit
LDNTFRVGVASHEKPSALQSNFMKNRTSNIMFVLVGILLLFVSTRSLLHHHYDYFDSVGQMWIPYFALLLLGVWIFLCGLVGLVRNARGTAK